MRGWEGLQGFLSVKPLQQWGGSFLHFLSSTLKDASLNYTLFSLLLKRVPLALANCFLLFEKGVRYPVNKLKRLKQHVLLKKSAPLLPRTDCCLRRIFLCPPPHHGLRSGERPLQLHLLSAASTSAHGRGLTFTNLLDRIPPHGRTTGY